MIICGIDQSLSATAVVIFNKETKEVIKFRVFKSNPKRDGVKLELEDRLENFAHHILSYILNNEVEYIAIESLSLMSKSSSSLMLAGLYYHLLLEFKKNFIPFSKVPPKSLKKMATGNGNASKIEMFNAVEPSVQGRFMEAGFKKTTGLYDLADAYHLGKTILK